MSSSAKKFVIAEGGKPCALYISDTDYPAAIRAARSFASDLAALAGTAPVFAVGAGGKAGAGGPVGAVDSAVGAAAIPPGARAIVVGTLGRGGVIDELADAGRIGAASIRGGRERYLRALVEGPLPAPLSHLSGALVIAGSDRRGTVYGLYDLLPSFGVSPWAWWADVPIPRRPDLALSDTDVVSRESAVRYRGIFLNDEEPCLGVWAREKFGGLNSAFYEKVCELILRLGGNFLWPAMWGKSFFEDDPASPGLADEMGVVIGTSHHEPLCRAHDEWRRHGKGPWNYEKNAEVLEEFWREGYARSAGYEVVATIGMRGDGDEPMSDDENVALLERIVSEQRKIIAEVSGRASEEQPQAWAVYKEVQEYYDRGMRVPEDVTIVLADDNWGNMRRLPPRDKVGRKGGFGMYYHFDYVGGPRCYKWIGTSQVSRIWEQMRMAYDCGIDRLWIVNVGDLKPYEYSIDFFLRLARDADLMGPDSLESFPRDWAEEQFGSERASEIAELLEEYARLASRRKPELLSARTYSLIDYREADRVLAEHSSLARRAERIARELGPEYSAAYFQLVLYPIQALATVHEMYVAQGRNALYAAQGRASAETQAEKAAAAFERDAELARAYNEDLSGGKWRHLMDQTHISYAYWRDPAKDVAPPLVRVELPDEPRMGVAIEGSDQAWPGGEGGAFLELDPYAGKERYVEVFNRGAKSFTFTAKPDASYLIVEPREGEIGDDLRLKVSVDWDKAPAGESLPRVELVGSEGTIVQVMVMVRSYAAPAHAEGPLFVEGSGCVAIEAEHCHRAAGGPGLQWTRVPRLGRTLSAMTVMPAPARPGAPAVAAPPAAEPPCLEYKICLGRDAEVEVEVVHSPPQDLFKTGGPRYGLGFDGGPTIEVRLCGESEGAAWDRYVSDNASRSLTRHGRLAAGVHTLRYVAIDPALPLQRVIVWTGPRRRSYLGPPESERADG